MQCFQVKYKLNMYKRYSHISCVAMYCSIYCYTSQVSFSSCIPIFSNLWFRMCFFLQDFLQKLIRLLDSPSVVIRAKAFVVIHEVVKNNYDLLLNSCQSRYTNLFKVEIRHSLSTISKLMIFLVDTILHRTQIPINYTEHFFKTYQNLT